MSIKGLGLSSAGFLRQGIRKALHLSVTGFLRIENEAPEELFVQPSTYGGGAHARRRAQLRRILANNNVALILALEGVT